MILFKKFDLKTVSNEEVNDFLKEVRVMKDGMMFSDGGIMTILYRAKDEYGLDQDGIVSNLQGELGSAQTKLIKQRVEIIKTETIANNFTDMSEDMKNEQKKYLEALNKEVDMLVKSIDAIKEAMKQAVEGTFTV